MSKCFGLSVQEVEDQPLICTQPRLAKAVPRAILGYRSSYLRTRVAKDYMRLVM